MKTAAGCELTARAYALVFQRDCGAALSCSCSAERDNLWPNLKLKPCLAGAELNTVGASNLNLNSSKKRAGDRRRRHVRHPVLRLDSNGRLQRARQKQAAQLGETPRTSGSAETGAPSRSLSPSSMEELYLSASARQ
ncbi:hypothetical protein EVAR_76369_1 [Eumeta japonica]|uniref:Uncharacterized protein n=1 Tax=Eumeta variegata TaxID=151549 RepID=A0A4C1TAC2_EUMVA|nr:hypothetical protein EVAR_76369_1 [Eumeta japonica]